MRLDFMLLVILLNGCSSYEDSVQRPVTAAAVTADATAAPSKSSTETTTTKAISLPSQQAQVYKMTGERPAEVCMEKGWNWLYQGYLQPQCASCHNATNTFGVHAFAEPKDAAGSFEVMKASVDKAVFLSMTLENSFCKTCTIKAADPLYKDLQYFTEHLTSCEKP